jgi:hypothetical protein
MKSFYQFILESVLFEKAPAPATGALEAANKTNTAFGDAYETATVLHLHHRTAARDNRDKEYQSKIKHVEEKHKRAMDQLPLKKQEEATTFGARSSHAYLKSLSEQGINPDHIHEVHHTSQGISSHMGKPVDRASNPHDLIIKGSKDGKSFMHGASLKAKSGTASNNSVAAFEKASAAGGSKLGLSTNISKHWEEGKKEAGLTSKTAKAIKELRHDPKVKEINTKTQAAAASTHAEDFNNASHETKQKHLLHFLKGNPLLPYHYVVGNKGTSTPIKLHPAIQAINKSKSITATSKAGVVHFHDQDGNHIASAEHRTTHGAFVSPQVNFKFGKVKAAK